MQRVEIRNFGPIKNIHIPITDIIVLNGVQSSGKSTLAKCIYMFKELSNTLYIHMAVDKITIEDFDKDIVIAIRQQFISIFGTTKHMDDFYIKFQYTKEKYIEIEKDHRSGHAYVKFSSVLKKELKIIIQNILQFQEFNNAQNDLDFEAIQIRKHSFLNDIRKRINGIFQENREAIFIPAGRSLVSTMSGELKDIDSYNFDYLMKRFVQRVFFMKDIFSKDQDEILEDRKKLTTSKIDFRKVELAKNLTNKILRGKYIYENGEERILIDDEHYVKLKFSSSGQQEILWILNILYLIILEQKSSFVVYEEPEAHMYPVTQYYVIQLLALYFSLGNSQGIITTHSPYIMAAINNLLYAGQSNNPNIKSVIDENFWIDYNKVSAYFIENGSAIDMIDSETNLINTHFIDKASEMINDDFDKLLELSDA